MPEEREATIDQRLLERGRDYRRVVPKDIDTRFLGLLIEVAEPQAVRVSKKGLIEEVPKEERKASARLIERPFSKKEQEELDAFEKELTRTVIRELVRPATHAIGDGNANIVPYENRFTVDAAVQEFREIEKVIEEATGGGRGMRAEKILEDIRATRTWMEGNAGLLKGAGPMLAAFYDGWAAVANAVRIQPRYDVTATDLYKMYSSPSEHPDWQLGKEIKRRQDEIYMTMRGIAAVNRHWGRNMGQPIEGDIPINERQVGFVEKVFGHNPRSEKGEGTGNVETVWAVVKRDGALGYLKEYFSDSKTKEVRIAVGKLYTVTEELLKHLRAEGIRGRKIWINGVARPINEETMGELKWKLGSNDVVFVGEDATVSNKDYEKKIKGIRDTDAHVAVLRETPREINNLFLMAQDPDRVIQVKRKLAVMAELGIWERLEKKDADVEAIEEEFNVVLEKYTQEFGAYGLDILDEHLIETARIALLYFCEGANLGWGFEYQGGESTPDGRPTPIKRIMSMAGTKAATDVATPFFWLYTEANNGWKMWSHGSLPLDERSRRQIIEHEPGWAPWKDKQNGVWRVWFKKKQFIADVPTKFPMSFLETATLVNMGPEYRKAVAGGKQVPAKIMDLIREGPVGGAPLKMSEIPWRKMIQEAPYRWYITLSQISMGIALLSRLPDKETVEKFFGERMDIVKNTQLLELMKRQALGWRDMAAEKDVERFLPFSVALYLAWSENMLETSRNPGHFIPADVQRTTRFTAASLKEIAPKGNYQLAQSMANRFSRYMDQLLEVGKEVSKEVSIKGLRSRFGI